MKGHSCTDNFTSDRRMCSVRLSHLFRTGKVGSFFPSTPLGVAGSGAPSSVTTHEVAKLLTPWTQGPEQVL